MRISTIVLTAASLLTAGFTVRAEERWAGDWMMNRLTINVTVTSWGENCGVKPKSYAADASTAVKVKEADGHLIFDKGDIRTDACGSLNPKVHSVLAKKSDGRWKRICKTEADDPKSEQGEYLLEAADDNRLEYTATSSFDWTLKGDHCVAGSVERRTYIRDSATVKSPIDEKVSSPAPTPPPPSKEKGIGLPAQIDKDLDPDCVSPGPQARVEISPKSAVIGPGERICLDAASYDTQGCKTGENLRTNWTAEQDGRLIPQLISGNGCFQAGETAADSEGTYLVTARISGRSAVAEISVVFPDLGELFAARLRPLEDVVETVTPLKKIKAPLIDTEAPPSTTSIIGNDTPAVALPADAADNYSERALMLGIIAAMVLLVVGAILFLKMRRVQIDDEEEEDDFDASLRMRKFPEKSTASRESFSETRPSTARIKGKLCPSCGKTFDIFAKFCPYDKHDLVPISSGSQDSPTGMICPKCHRGYDSGAQFCPHDAAPLVPYSEWRLSKLPPAP